jgi:hypothetical protein
VGTQCADQTTRQKSLFPSAPRASSAGADQPRCPVWAEKDRALFGPRTRCSVPKLVTKVMSWDSLTPRDHDMITGCAAPTAVSDLCHGAQLAQAARPQHHRQGHRDPDPAPRSHRAAPLAQQTPPRGCCICGGRGRAGCADAPSPSSSPVTAVRVRGLPLPSGRDHGRGAVVPLIGEPDTVPPLTPLLICGLFRALIDSLSRRHYLLSTGRGEDRQVEAD